MPIPTRTGKLVKVDPSEILPKREVKNLQQIAEDEFYEEAKFQLNNAMVRYDKVCFEPAKQIIENCLLDYEIDGEIDYIDMWNKLKRYGNKVEDIRAAAGYQFDKWKAEEEVHEFLANGGKFTEDKTLSFLNESVNIDDDPNSEPVLSQRYEIDVRSLVDEEDEIPIKPVQTSTNITKNKEETSNSIAIDPSLFDD